MNKNRPISALLLLTVMMTVPLISHAKDRENKAATVYIFGFAQSMTDSVVYFTDIQSINNIWIDGKTKFLLGRQEYSNQMRDYLLEQGKQNFSCVTLFATSRKKLEKKYQRLKQRYATHGHNQVNFINENDMKYKAFEPAQEVRQ